MAQPPPRPNWSSYTPDANYFQQQMYNVPFHPARFPKLCCQTIRCPEPMRAYQQTPYVQSVQLQENPEHDPRHSVPVSPYWARNSTHTPPYHHSGLVHRPYQMGYTHNNYNLHYRFHPYNNQSPKSNTPSPVIRPSNQNKIRKKAPELDVRQFLATWQDKDDEIIEENNVLPETIIHPAPNKETFQPLDYTIRNENTNILHHESRDTSLHDHPVDFNNHRAYLQQNKQLYTSNSVFPQSFTYKEATEQVDKVHQTTISTSETNNEYYGNRPVSGYRINNKHGKYPPPNWQISSMPCERRIDKISNPNSNFNNESMALMQVDNCKNNGEYSGPSSNNFTDMNNSMRVNYGSCKQNEQKYNFNNCLGTDELFGDVNKKREERQKLVVHPLRHDYNFNHNSPSEGDLPHMYIKPSINDSHLEQSLNHGSVIVHATSNSSELPHWDESRINIHQKTYTDLTNNRQVSPAIKSLVNNEHDKGIPYNYCETLSAIDIVDNKSTSNRLNKLNSKHKTISQQSIIEKPKPEFNFKGAISTICTVVANQIKPFCIETNSSENDHRFFDESNERNRNIIVGEENGTPPQTSEIIESCLSSEDIDITITSSVGELDLMGSTTIKSSLPRKINVDQELIGTTTDPPISLENKSPNFVGCSIGRNPEMVIKKKEDIEEKESENEIFPKQSPRENLMTTVENIPICKEKSGPKNSPEITKYDAKSTVTDASCENNHNLKSEQFQTEALKEIESGGYKEVVEDEPTLDTNVESHGILTFNFNNSISFDYKNDEYSSGEKLFNECISPYDRKLNKKSIENINAQNLNLIDSSLSELQKNSSPHPMKPLLNLSKSSNTFSETVQYTFSKKGPSNEFESYKCKFQSNFENEECSGTGGEVSKTVESSSSEKNFEVKYNENHNKSNNLDYNYGNIKAMETSISQFEDEIVNKSKIALASKVKQNCKIKADCEHVTTEKKQNLCVNVQIEIGKFQGKEEHGSKFQEKSSIIEIPKTYSYIKKFNSLFTKKEHQQKYRLKSKHCNLAALHFVTKQIVKKYKYLIKKKEKCKTWKDKVNSNVKKDDNSFLQDLRLKVISRTKKFYNLHQVVKKIISKYVLLKHKTYKNNQGRMNRKAFKGTLRNIKRLEKEMDNFMSRTACLKKVNLKYCDVTQDSGLKNQITLQVSSPSNVDSVLGTNPELECSMNPQNISQFDKNNDINGNILVENSDWSLREEEKDIHNEINLKCSLRWDKIFNINEKMCEGQTKTGSELNLGPAKVGVCLVDSRAPGQWRVVGRGKESGPHVVKVVKRIIMQPKTTTISEERVPKVIIKKTGGKRYESYLKEELQPTVMLERRSEIDILARECDNLGRIKCIGCSSFFSQETFSNHLCTRKEAHHCCLCQQTFSSINTLHLHQDTLPHRHLEMIQRNAAHRVHKQLTGNNYPLFEPLSADDVNFLNWKPDYPGYTHFYHNPPLSNNEVSK